MKLARQWLLALALGALLWLGSQPARASAPVPIRIMPLGDSITSSVLGQVSYRHWLWYTMNAAGYSVDFVGSLCGVYEADPPSPCAIWDADHEGHYGYTTDRVRDNITAWATATQPDVVLIHLGHNDLWLEDKDTISVVIDRTITELGQVIDRLRAVNSRVKILLAQLIPSCYPGRLEYIDELNAKIPALVATKSSHISPVRVVDQWTGFDPLADTLPYPDCVHPDESGEKKMSARWFSVFDLLMRQDKFFFLPIVIK